MKKDGSGEDLGTRCPGRADQMVASNSPGGLKQLKAKNVEKIFRPQKNIPNKSNVSKHIKKKWAAEGIATNPLSR